MATSTAELCHFGGGRKQIKGLKVISQSLYDLNLFYQKCTNSMENRKVLAFNNGQKNEKRFNDDAIFMEVCVDDCCRDINNVGFSKL
ncbi:hypothetical protein RUM43_000221 [Polyplax serrata]|uniref:Uncharacterized protein n=1 Tax=Polyplax serrata TaxID=468196 RepID=A0AAN8SDP0_POLSC